VQGPIKYELAIKSKTAKVLSFTVPTLVRADEVRELALGSSSAR